MDLKTTQAIEKRVVRVLTAISCRDPPVSVEDVLKYLDLHRGYYDLENPSFKDDLFHKAKLTLKKVMDVVKKTGLRALWLPDDGKVMLDRNLPKTREKYTTAHEIGHKLNPHHSHFFAVGDTALTLNPSYHEMLEQEAHFAASELIFMGGRFTADALDCAPGFRSVVSLKDVYQNSLTSTLRRFVVYSHEMPMLGIVSRPTWGIGCASRHEGVEDERCRYFIPNEAFIEQFGNHSADSVLDLVEPQLHAARGGTVGEGTVVLNDVNNESAAFVFETFFNQHDLLTLVVYEHAVGVVVPLPRAMRK